jgi:hypothetical protein
LNSQFLIKAVEGHYPTAKYAKTIAALSNLGADWMKVTK